MAIWFLLELGKNSSQCLSHLSFVMQKVGTQFIFEYGSG